MIGMAETPVEAFKRLYYTLDETNRADYERLLDEANRLFWPSPPPPSYPVSGSGWTQPSPALQPTSFPGGTGGWPPHGRKFLTRKKKHRVSNKLKTRKH